MTPVTYEEAARTLNVRIEALRNAAARGVLTRLPRTGTLQPLVREQVMLFQGKKRLSLNALSNQEKEAWAQYATMAETQEKEAWAQFVPMTESNAPIQTNNHESKSAAPLGELGIITSLGVLLSLAAILAAISDRPTVEEIERVISTIKSIEQRETIKRLLLDDSARETLRELISAA